MEKNNSRSGRGIRQVNGQKVMTTKKFSAMYGISVKAIAHRVLQAKSECPGHAYSFDDECPVYFDDTIFQKVADNMQEHPLRKSSITNVKRYEKFLAKYGNADVKEEEKEADAQAVAADVVESAVEAADVELKTVAKDEAAKEQKHDATDMNNTILANLVNAQARELEQMHTRVCDLVSENNTLKNSLADKDSVYVELQAKYAALQEKYIAHVETSNERMYNLAMSRNTETTQAQAQPENNVTEENTEDNIILVG